MTKQRGGGKYKLADFAGLAPLELAVQQGDVAMVETILGQLDAEMSGEGGGHAASGSNETQAHSCTTMHCTPRT